MLISYKLPTYPTKHILIFGDGLTTLPNTSGIQTWVDILRTDISGSPFVLLNMSVQEEQTHNLLQRFHTEAGIRKPDAIIFQTGLYSAAYSDVDVYTSLAEIESAISILATNAQHLVGSKVLFLGYPQLPDTLMTKRDCIEFDISLRNTIQNTNAKFVSLFNTLDSSVHFHNSHPNQQGQLALYNHIKETVFKGV